MAFRWRADDGPLLLYLDPLSLHQLKWHWIFFMSESKLPLPREKERERERERERYILINGITNE